jgi:hypothetical protein
MYALTWKMHYSRRRPTDLGAKDRQHVALDENGKSSFQLLQSYGTGKEIPLVYHGFELYELTNRLRTLFVSPDEAAHQGVFP